MEKHASVDADVDIRMVLAYYDLQAQPFRPSPDPDFLWLGEAHKKGLATLKSAVLENKGVLLLTGDVGTGKTTLTNALINSLGEQVIVGRVFYPRLEPFEFIKVIADAYKLTGPFISRDAFLGEFRRFLAEASAEDRRVLLVIDEAQSLSVELFEEIRHLADLGESEESRLNVLLVGQRELNHVVGSAALNGKIALRWNIDPLSKDEVGEYIRHRLAVAGSRRNPFSSGAIREIGAFSGGIPRLINMIGDLALLRGCRRAAGTIEAELVRECAKEIAPEGSRARLQVQKAHEAAPGRRGRRGRRRRHPGRAAVSVAAVALVLMIAGYVLYSGRSSGSGRASAPQTSALQGSGPKESQEPAGQEGHAEIAEGERNPEPPNIRTPETETPTMKPVRVESSASSRPRNPVDPIEGCVKPSTPLDAFAVESGEALGRWVDVDIDTTSQPGRCLYVIRRGDSTRWVIDSSRVRVEFRSTPRGQEPLKAAATETGRRSLAEQGNLPSRSGERGTAASGAERSRFTPASRDDAVAEEADSPDPSAIIDWLLREYPARRQ